MNVNSHGVKGTTIKPVQLAREVGWPGQESSVEEGGAPDLDSIACKTTTAGPSATRVDLWLNRKRAAPYSKLSESLTSRLVILPLSHDEAVSWRLNIFVQS